MIQLTETDLNVVSTAKNIRFRSEETQEIINRASDPFEKWALLIFLFIIMLIVGGTSFVKYPDIVEGGAVLTGRNAPQKIVTQQGGRLVALFLENNHRVKANQIIGWFESAANTEDILRLSAVLDTGSQYLLSNRMEDLAELFRGSFNYLGELQGSYQTFITAWQQFDDYLVNGFYNNRKKELIQSDHNFLLQKKLFEQALYMLKDRAGEWINKFVIRSPVNGTLSFVLPLQKNQFLEEGKLIGYVTSDDINYYAEVKLTQSSFGKVDTGMNVQLRFDAYPYLEMGFVRGKLSYVSSVSVDSCFSGWIELPEGLMTSRKKNLQFRNGLNARALIIAKDMTLLQRICYGITKSIDMNK